MQLHEDGTLVVSATDLVGYLECDHLVTLEQLRARGELEKPFRDDPQLELVRKRGYDHEQRYIARLGELGRTVVEMQLRDPQTPADLRASEAETLAAMRAGADVIFQGTLFDGRWRGHPDFLVRRSDRPSDLGSWSYDVADTKLAKRVKAAAILQMCVYADLLERLQGIPPETVSVVTGDREAHEHRLADYAAYYRAAKRRFEERVFPPSPVADPPATYPEPVEHCRVCSWWQACMDRRRADDHLSIVAGAATSHRRKLVDAGVPTLAALARLPGDRGIRDLNGRVLERLRRQAALQLAKREDGVDRYELIPPNPDEPGKGLAALPPPSPLDVFFDIEADPWALDDGLEYLFGWAERDPATGEPVFNALWAHDREQEKAMLETFVDLVLERRERDPGMHVYHYGGYESGALKRLMQRHATREDEIDVLLRGRVLVNLYDHVVRQGVRASVESYSIKKLETFYMPERVGPVTQAGFSVVEYERWMEEQDPAILQAIADYNRDDCVSNLLLRDWLEDRRTEALASHPEWYPDGDIPRPSPEDGAPPERLAQEQAETRAREEALRAGVPADARARTPEQQARWLLAGLLDWHRREAKPQWWLWYQLREAPMEDLVRNAEALAELEFVLDLGPVARSVLHRYRFDPAQDTKIKEGDTVFDPHADAPGMTVVALDPLTGSIDLKRNPGFPHPRALVPGTPFATDAQRAALGRLADQVIAHGIEGPGPYLAARDLVLRRLPRISGLAEGEPLARAGETGTEAGRRLAVGLDGTVLAIQGPPGTGKTYTAARMILDLVAAGRRVGVTAQSHRVIANLLEAIAQANADEGGPVVRIGQRCDDPQEASSHPGIVRLPDNGAVRRGLRDGTWDVVGGTAWLWARGDMEGSVDVLFVDEAGQFSLANACAVAGAAGSLVLLGDPNQLPQVSQGTHPEGAGASALEHLVGDARTIAPERGLLLDTTYRLHPDVNAFISDAFYEGRLETDAANAIQHLDDGPPVGGTGIRHVALEHDGAGNRSRVEAEWVAEAIAALVGRRWRDRRGRERPLTADDVLVVAPYNAQVAEIARTVEARLGVRANVGTVDKFQGREAPVAVYSMTTSTPEEAPRELEFLYSGNRLNVAISRARGLAVLVANPALLRVACHTPEQMRLVNALCRLVEVAGEQRAARPEIAGDVAARPAAVPAAKLEGEALLLFPDLGPADRRRG
ncbi:MAG: TM0106 family RecB-like putative nuclease [Chloroflexota bacterium]